MVSRNDRFKLVAGLLLVCLVLSITGCGSPYSARERTVAQLFAQRQENALNSNVPSELTQQYLRLENLTDLYKKDREVFFSELYDRLIQSEDLQGVRALAELSVLEGRRQSKGNREAAVAFYLTAAETSYRYLLADDLLSARAALDPTYRFVAEMYNAAVSELVGLYEDRQIPWPDRGSFSAGDTVYEFELIGPSQTAWDPDMFDQLLPAYKTRAKGLRNQYYTNGLGAPLIGIINNPSEKMPLGQFFANRKTGYPLTAMLIFEPFRMEGTRRHVPVRIVFCNALAQDEIVLEGVQIPLEVDYSAPLVIQLENINPLKLGLWSMFNSDKKISDAGLFLLEPYDPDKIPVVMVHGLMSSPVTWIEMLNDLRGQPEIRNRYQFWFFSYPTGLPILYSSSILRDNLLAIQQKLDPDLSNPNFNNMVLVGHSMGGLLSRVMMQNSGSAYWDYLFEESIDEIQIDESSRELLRHTLFFENIPFVQRVIFIATPHRGSPIADNWYSSIASAMIDLPGNLVDTMQGVLSEDQLKFNQEIYRNTKKVRFRSIDNLSATSPFTTIYNQIPVRKDVTYHSIIGLRNAKTGPGSSDGVVPYESSHIDFSVSERLVPFNHGAHQHPDAINEVKRILLLHLKESE